MELAAANAQEALLINVAYLNTEYPSLSHTFIEREIRALRRQGASVQPFSVRPACEHGKLGPDHERAARETVPLLINPAALLLEALLVALLNPLGAVRGLAASQKLACPGLRSRLKHLAYLAEAMRLVRQMCRRGLRHIHVHMANNGAAVALLATKVNRSLSYSITIHGSAEFFHTDTWRLREKASGALFVRCISSFGRAQVMAWTPPEVWERTHVVHCGLDVRRYHRTTHDDRPGLRLLTVGRLHPIKGYPLLLEACAELTSRGIDWTLDMVGDGPLRADLERLAHELKIEGRIRFSGPVGQDKIAEHFELANVMVMSSFMEGIPVVLMEAMAMELPVVATAVGGVPELVEQGVSGELIPPASAPALVEALVRMARANGSLAPMRAAARRKVEREFDIRDSGREMFALLERYAGRERPAPSTLPALAGAVYSRLSVALSSLLTLL